MENFPSLYFVKPLHSMVEYSYSYIKYLIFNDMRDGEGVIFT